MSLKIAISGSRGFIGKYLIDSLSNNDYEIVRFEKNGKNDILKWENIKKIDDIDIFIHLASLSYVPASFEKPRDFYETNVVGTLNILELCRKNNAKMIFASSYVYGIPQYLPIDELHPLEPLNPYAHTKILAETLCKSYNENFLVPVIILRPSNIYGFGQNDNFLIPKIFSQINNRKLNLRDSKPKRDYVYVKDVVSAFLSAIKYDLKSNLEIFNIGSGHSNSVKDIVNIILKEKRKDIEVFYGDSDRKMEVMDVRYNICKAKNLLGWEPKYDILEGLKDMIEYY